MPSDELWNWKKFFSGFFNGKNYAKAIVLGFCLLVICTIIFSVIKTVNFYFNKPKQPTHASANPINGNTGTITQEDDHSTETVVHNHSPLENGLLGAIFGSKDQVIKEQNSKQCHPPKAVLEVNKVE